MKKLLLVLLGLLLWTEACSPPDEHSPSPAVTPPEGNQSKLPDNNASIPLNPEDNQTDAPAPQSDTGLAAFLRGKQISLEVANDAIKLAPQFGANGTWTNALDPKQHGPYSVMKDGRVILNLPDKNKLTLFFDGNSVKSDDMVGVMKGDTLIQSTVKTIK